MPHLAPVARQARGKATGLFRPSTWPKREGGAARKRGRRGQRERCGTATEACKSVRLTAEDGAKSRSGVSQHQQ